MKRYIADRRSVYTGSDSLIMEWLRGPGARMPWLWFPRMKGLDAMATMPRGQDATSCRKWPKSWILIITALTVLELWAERIDYNQINHSISMLLGVASFTCKFDDYLWKSYVYRTTFSNVKFQDLCATINTSKIKYLQNRKQSLKYLCNINLIGFLQKPDVYLLNQNTCVLSLKKY